MSRPKGGAALATLRRQELICLMVIGAASAYSHAPCAFADDATAVVGPRSADTGLDEIVVTAQRRSESLLSVPIAVTALSHDELVSQGINQPANLASVVPNLRVNDSTGGAEPNFTLRGVGLGNDYDSNQASPVGVYVDDAYLAFRATYGAQMFDLDRVEVLRGPQGTLYGRNTTGGAINFITQKPGLAGDNGYIDVGYGNFNDVHVNAAAEGTPVNDVLGIRGAISFERHDGYIRNDFPNASDLATEENVRGRITARFKPNEQLDIDIRAFAQRARQIQPGVFQVGAGQDGADPFTGYTRGNLDFFSVDSDNPHENEVLARGVSATIKYDFSQSLSLQSLTSFDTASSIFGQDVDGSPVNLLQTFFDSKYSEVNQELRLSYNGDVLRFQTGGYYGRDRITVDNRYDLLGFLEQLGVPADPTLTAGGATIIQHYAQIRASKALFGQADIQLASKLNATIGARYTWDNAEYRDGSAFIGDYHYVPLVQTVGSPGAPLDQDGSNSALTGRGALTYSFLPDRIVYASYSRGYRAGTFNGSGYLSPSQINYVQPEKVNAYEAGAKGRFFSGFLTVSAAAFDYDYTNQQLQEVVGPVAFLRNAGSSRVKGAEIESTLRFTPRVVLTTNLGYTHGIYDSLTLSGTNLSGNRLPFTPEVTANSRVDITIPGIATGDLVFMPSINYTSQQFFSPFNTLAGNAPLQQGGYVLFDGNIEWRKGPWNLTLWGKNLADKGAFVYGNNFVGTVGFYYFNQNQPRTFGVSIRRTF